MKLQLWGKINYGKYGTFALTIFSTLGIFLNSCQMIHFQFSSLKICRWANYICCTAAQINGFRGSWIVKCSVGMLTPWHFFSKLVSWHYQFLNCRHIFCLMADRLADWLGGRQAGRLADDNLPAGWLLWCNNFEESLSQSPLIQASLSLFPCSDIIQFSWQQWKDRNGAAARKGFYLCDTANVHNEYGSLIVRIERIFFSIVLTSKHNTWTEI